MSVFLSFLFTIVVTTSAPAQDASLSWVALGGGCFTMGSAQAYPEERPEREVCVEPFEMTTTEITNAQFSAFVEATGYVTRAERGWRADEAGGPGIDLPAGSAIFIAPQGRVPKNLNWWRFVEGANWRNVTGTDDTAPSQNAPVVHVIQADAMAFARWAGGRLPSEAEWEFAARAGTDGNIKEWTKAEKDALNDRANTWQGIFPVVNTGQDGHAGISPVASFQPNPLGLYDMIGNVWEWTATPYAPSHAERDRTLAGPNGLDPAQPGVDVATIKGGSYLCSFSYCIRFRPAARQAQDLTIGTSHIGFRIVRPARKE